MLVIHHGFGKVEAQKLALCGEDEPGRLGVWRRQRVTQAGLLGFYTFLAKVMMKSVHPFHSAQTEFARQDTFLSSQLVKDFRQ